MLAICRVHFGKLQVSRIFSVVRPADVMMIKPFITALMVFLSVSYKKRQGLCVIQLGSFSSTV